MNNFVPNVFFSFSLTNQAATLPLMFQMEIFILIAMSHLETKVLTWNKLDAVIYDVKV